MRSTQPRHPTGRIAAAVALALALVLSGCGGDGEQESADSDATSQPAAPAESEAQPSAVDVPDLCTLVTAADFESVLGARPGGEPESTPATGAIRGVCTWSAEVGFPMLMISAYDAADREATLEMVDSEPVDGLGAEADWADQTGLLIVVEGQDWYLQVFAAGTDDDRAASISVAEIVLENLS